MEVKGFLQDAPQNFKYYPRCQKNCKEVIKMFQANYGMPSICHANLHISCTFLFTIHFHTF